MDKIRVLVVEDSITIRKALIDAFENDPDLEVVGEAGDGRTAIDLCQRLRPDVVTLDMMLPVMTGLAATEYIMAHCPTPVLIVSASVNRGELFRTYDALAAGAVDVLEKPRGDEPHGAWERQLIAAVKLVSRIKVITHLRGKSMSIPAAGTTLPATPPARAPSPLDTGARTAGARIVAIGASTGGPAALLEILRALPESFPLPILVVLHISEPFAHALAEWLDGLVALPVAYAQDGEVLPGPGKGRVVLAPPDRHLVVAGGRLRLLATPERHSCRPSVDELFESLAREVGPGCVASLLTGMGKDGAAGLLAIRRAGGTTIAQDQATSVVFGMPREAVALGAAQRVLPVQEIAAQLASLDAGAARGRT